MYQVWVRCRLGSKIFMLLVSQTAVLPGSDAGRDGVEPSSSFVIQNRQISWSMWCPILLGLNLCYFSGVAQAIDKGTKLH